jgi:hypothetical protein
LPRTPFAKSYSGGNSLSADLADGFFIVFSFTAAWEPRTDDADIIAAFGVDDNQYSALMRPPQNDEPMLGLRVRWIRDGQGNGIAKTVVAS